MPLERQVIEKKDFPIGRRGYDPEAVDAHLAAVADEVDQLKSQSRRRSETLASTASAQVKAIVEAAESSAAEITRQAEDDAADIRAEASQEAAVVRQQANTQAREYVGQVSESTAVMLQRLDAMESELSALLEALRTGSNRLGADLQLLEGNLGDVRTAVQPREPFELEAPSYSGGSSAPAPAPTFGSAPSIGRSEVFPAEESLTEADDLDEDTVDDGPLAAAPVASPPEFAAESTPAESPTFAEAAPAPAADVDGGGDEDVEGARLVALNMALNGTPRDETDRYLAENFSLGDRARLLDEVYASVEG